MKLKGLWDELSSYNDTIQGTQQEQQKLMQFLMGLNDSYSAIRGQILLKNPLFSIRQAYSSISQEEKQRLLSSTLTSDCSGSSVAMAVRHNNSRRTGNFGARTWRPERFHHSYRSHDFRSQEKSLENTSGE